MTTTADLRRAAAEAETMRDWARAAELWGQAIARYPRTTGQLAAADLWRMKERRNENLREVRNIEQEAKRLAREEQLRRAYRSLAIG